MLSKYTDEMLRSTYCPEDTGNFRVVSINSVLESEQSRDAITMSLCYKDAHQPSAVVEAGQASSNPADHDLHHDCAHSTSTWMYWITCCMSKSSSPDPSPRDSI